MNTFKFRAATLAAVLSSLPLAAAAEEPASALSNAAAQEPDAAPSNGAAPFQLTLWDSVQVIDATRSIHGVRLALPYGRNWNVYGADIGFVNRVDHDLVGGQLSLAGMVDGDMKGFQNNLFYGSVGGEMQGVQMSAVNSAGSFRGAQFGAVNYARDGANGAGFALVNVYEGPSVGSALGLVNYAPRVEGVQIGVVNVTDHLRGVQIGLVNVATNGFLPVFVIFNAAL